jgi:HD superfamily phosphohydrolase
MRVFDPLYGEFRLSPQIAAIASAPEVRRLSQVRLLNTLSPSLATLGEVRRYSHTLGVLYLATQNEFVASSPDRLRAFQTAVLLHDIGTPPFGHLLEYHLRDRYNWHHEDIVGSILWGGHAPENTAHQIFARQTGRIRRLLANLGIPIDQVQRIIDKQDPIGRLLAGTLDFDNLDNVARMAMCLGRYDTGIVSIQIARALRVNHNGELVLRRSFRDHVLQWQRARRWVYSILTTDPPTLAAQAVLSEAVGLAIGGGHIGIEDWSMSDEDLIERLFSITATKKLMLSYLGQLPHLLLIARRTGTLADLGFADRRTFHGQVHSQLMSETQDASLLCYVFVDRGALERRLEFIDPEDETTWAVGESSSSVFLYVFSKSNSAVRERVLRSLEKSLDDGWAINLPSDCDGAAKVGEQPTFDFEAATS